MDKQPITVQAFHSFADLKLAFPELLTTPTGYELFYTPEWFATLAQYGNTFQGQLQLIVAQNHDSGEILSLPTIDGKHLTGLSNYYSSLYGPIGERNSISLELYQALAQWIAGQAKKWPTIDLHPIDTNEPFFKHMLESLKSAGYWADSYSCFGNWYHRTAGHSYADYLATRPSRLRNTIKRNGKKIQNAGQVDIEIHQQPGSALEAAIGEFSNVYKNSWKPAESHPEFVAELCRISAVQGWLRLGILKFQGEAIAAQIWLVCGGKANIFKLAYLQDNNPFSAGTLLTAEMMRHVIDIDHVQEIDYLTGDDAYKKDWMSERRERKGIIAFNPYTLNGLLTASKHFAGKLTKHRI